MYRYMIQCFIITFGALRASSLGVFKISQNKLVLTTAVLTWDPTQQSPRPR